MFTFQAWYDGTNLLYGLGSDLIFGFGIYLAYKKVNKGS
jgi:hypothetical protein